MRFSDLIRHRLALLIKRHDTTPTKIYVSLGHARAGLTRKLVRPHKTERAFRIEDVDEVLEFLGETPAALFGPVLLDGDQAVLDWIASHEEATTWARLDRARATFTDTDARILRLAAEGLATLWRIDTGHNTYHVFNAGITDDRVPLVDLATLGSLS